MPEEITHITSLLDKVPINGVYECHRCKSEHTFVNGYIYRDSKYTAFSIRIEIPKLKTENDNGKIQIIGPTTNLISINCQYCNGSISIGSTNLQKEYDRDVLLSELLGERNSNELYDDENRRYGRVHFNCTSCGHKTTHKNEVINEYNIDMNVGDRLDFDCRQCGYSASIRVDESTI